MVVVLESARRSLSSCSNQLVARAWLGTIDVLRSLETLREFSHTSLPAFSVDLGVHNFGISKKGGLPRTLCNVQAAVNSRTGSHGTRNLRHPVAWQETTLGSLVSSPSAGVQQDCEQ